MRAGLAARVALASTLCALSSACSTSPSSTCQTFCSQLDTCHYLPSILGAMPASPIDADTVPAERDCETRCSISTSTGPMQDILSCKADLPVDAEKCLAVGQCLRAQFPGTPITGIGNVTVQGMVSSQPADASAGNVLTTCPTDMDTTASTTRAFVEAWGVRTYSESRLCSAGFQVEFDNVPAGQDLLAGFQFQDGRCWEYETLTPDLPAGSSDYPVEVDLSGETHGCPTDQHADAATADSGADR